MVKGILRALQLKEYCDGEHPMNGCDFEKVQAVVSQTLQEIRKELEGMKTVDEDGPVWTDKDKLIDQALQVIDKYVQHL
jgi:hypothetical protein